MDAIFVLLGLTIGLSAPVSLALIFKKSYEEERRRIASGGEVVYEKTLHKIHPELEQLSARAKELGMGE
jgi:hypothetical protein